MLRDIYSGIDPRILGRRLQAARKEAEVTQDEAATKLGLSRPTFAAIEKGDRLPKESELASLAILYNQSLHNLLRPNEPNASLEVQFRRSSRVDSEMETELRQIIQEVERHLADYRDLEAQLGISMPLIQAPIYQMPSDAPVLRYGEDVASAERNRLGRGDAPIRDFIHVLQEEEEALSIFQVPLPGPVAGFFGYDPALGPCIVLNLRHPPERRNWTLAHEYAHFLTRRHDAEIVVSYTYAHIPESERFANFFAKALLMPQTSLSRRFHRIKQAQGRFQPADISRLAHAFCVSFEAMARRLEEMRLIVPGTFEDLRDRGYHHGEALAHLKLEPYAMDSHEIPLRFEYLIGMAREQGVITEDEAMEYMGTTRVQLRQRLKALRTQTLVSDSGSLDTVEFPLTNAEGA